MAILSEVNRKDAHTELMRHQSENRKALAVTKADLKAAIDAADQWIEDNKASFNAAIPQPAKSTLTAQQKALLLQFVAAKRFGAA